MDLSKLGSIDLLSYQKVLKAYNKYARGEEIMDEGFNTSSGYVYIALENGVQIASCFGQKVDYIIYDNETEEEYFLDTYEDAITIILHKQKGIIKQIINN